jgi:dephospho-CoA kinase
MEKLKVITLVGMPGSGKSSCVEYLEKKGLPSVYFGGITLDEIKKRGLEINETNEKMVREDIRAKEGKDAYAKRMINKIEVLLSQGHQKIVADGLYGWSEYKIFKERFGDGALIIAIAAPRHLRHERLSKRPIRPLSKQEADARDYAEIENIEKGGPIANADYTIVNDRSIEDLLQKLDSVLNEVGVL